MIHIEEDYIKSLPVTTNRIAVSWNRDTFFEKYSIVSYYGQNEYKNLAYEQLSDTPTISVTGIYSRYGKQRYPSVKFFILVKKGEENSILQSLKNYDYITGKIDDLTVYDDKLQQRIIASLAINSLGKKRINKMMYNDGSLLICDNKNFLVPKSRKELVCLKIEINEYLLLTAKTMSFSNPHKVCELNKYRNCVFRVAKDIDGNWWEGQSVKPIVIKKAQDFEHQLDELYINKKRFSDNKNTVPYWPYNTNDYKHGRLFAIAQIVESVNELFADILEISFTDQTILHYDACKSEKDMTNLMQKHLSNKSIFIEDPFKTDGSKLMKEQFVKESQKVMDNCLKFSKKQKADDLLIRFCEPKESNKTGTYYSQSIERLGQNGIVQHITYSGNAREDEIKKASARRILIELLVKDCISRRQIPDELSSLMQGWTFYRYKLNQGFVHGGSMISDANGKLDFCEYGLSKNPLGEEYETFVNEHLLFDDCDKIKGRRDYMALAKEGNVYLIIDTDEIPILDVSLIDDVYEKVFKGEVLSVAFFKRKSEANNHKYLRGYMGFHLWKSEGINGEKDGSYSYISGKNSEGLTISEGTMMDKMPRVRRIFILNKSQPHLVESHIMEIENMLKFGFGRWNELMTYPFPFKFLQEYLDDVCEIVFSKHWKDITYKGEL